MEARPPAENRHGGAPRGERPASWDAPRLTRADPSRLANATTDIVRLSALRPPLQGDGRDHKDKTRAQQRAAGTNKTALFDIVNAAAANGSCTSRDFARSGSHTALRESSRGVPALVPFGFASLHSAGTRDRRAQPAGTLRLEMLGHLAAGLGELDHHLPVQPDIHLRRAVERAGITKLLGQFLAGAEAAVELE